MGSFRGFNIQRELDKLLGTVCIYRVCGCGVHGYCTLWQPLWCVHHDTNKWYCGVDIKTAHCCLHWLKYWLDYFFEYGSLCYEWCKELQRTFIFKWGWKKDTHKVVRVHVSHHICKQTANAPQNLTLFYYSTMQEHQCLFCITLWATQIAKCSWHWWFGPLLGCLHITIYLSSSEKSSCMV